MSMQQCHCHDMHKWVMRRGSVMLSGFVSISHLLCFKLWSHLICSYRPQLVNHLCVLFSLALSATLSVLLFLHLLCLHHLVLLHPFPPLSSQSCSLPSSDPVALHSTSCQEPQIHSPLTAVPLYSPSVILSQPLRELSAPQLTGMCCRSWQPTVIAACLTAYRSVTEQHPASASAQMRTCCLLSSHLHAHM